MKPKLQLNINVAKILYYRYKDFLIPVVTIIVSILAFIFFVVPTLQNWLALKDTINTNRQVLITMQQNISTVSTMNDSDLSNSLNTLTLALPSDKNFVGILQAISNAAAISNASLGDYSFPVGDIIGGSSASSGQLAIQINLSLKGNINNAKAFVSALKKQFPLSSIAQLSISNNSIISLTAIFYYYPFPKITFNDSIPIQNVTRDEVNLISSLEFNSQQASTSGGL